MKKKKKVLINIAVILFAIAIIQTLPVFFKKPFHCKTMNNEYINLYYQKGDEKGASEVFDLLSEKTEEMYAKMQVERRNSIDVYIYKSQFQLALREAGFITLTFAPSWYIGDCHKGTILMVSPYTKVKEHTHDSILTATLHELVHSINYQVNKDISYFWDNGLATYLANQIPDESDYITRTVPTINEMHTNNGLEFGNMGGYAFSYKYIEYLDKTYGWDKVVEFAKGNGSYEEIFNKSEEKIYQDWCVYLDSQKEKACITQIFDAAITECMESNNVTGATATLVIDGGVAFQKGYGYSDKASEVPVDISLSGFRIASVSKTFVAIAALIAAEDGKLDLNADITNYLEKDFLEFQYPVTLNDLLTHSAGFEDLVTGIAVKDINDMEPLYETIRKYKPKQIYKPGEVISYSNYGIALAAYVIEKATGVDFAEYCREKIFIPLGMNNTTFDYKCDNIILSKAYLPNGNETSEPYINIYPEGSVISTAEDMSKYIQWLLSDQENILKDKFKAKLFSCNFSMADELNGIGYTWNIISRNGIKYYEKKGEAINFYSRIVLYPNSNTGLFFSFNTYVSEEEMNAIIDNVTNTLLGKKEEDEKSVGATMKIEGNYLNIRSNFTTAEKFLSYIIPEKMLEITGTPSSGYKLNGHTITPIGNNTYDTPIGTIKFIEKNGKILLATNICQTYVKVNFFQSYKVTLIVTALFMINMLTIVFWSIIHTIKKRTTPKIVAIMCSLQLLAFIMLCAELIIGLSNYSVLSFAILIKITAWIILSIVIVNIVYSFLTCKKNSKIALIKYLYAHNIISIAFCLIMYNLNLL